MNQNYPIKIYRDTAYIYSYLFSAIFFLFFVGLLIFFIDGEHAEIVYFLMLTTILTSVACFYVSYQMYNKKDSPYIVIYHDGMSIDNNRIYWGNVQNITNKSSKHGSVSLYITFHDSASQRYPLYGGLDSTGNKFTDKDILELIDNQIIAQGNEDYKPYDNSLSILIAKIVSVIIFLLFILIIFLR